MGGRKRISDSRRIAERRGVGNGMDYKPWLTIQDTYTERNATREKSWVVGRDHDLLNPSQYDYFLLFNWADRMRDIREHFPLLYIDDTLDLAGDNGLDHPCDAETTLPCVITTDFVLTVQTPDGNVEHARSIVASRQLQYRPTLTVLEIQKLYWAERSIPWRVLTERELPHIVIKNIKQIFKHRDIADRVTLTAMEIERVGIQLTAMVQAKAEPFNNLAAALDKTMDVQPGTCLTIARHLIATKRWGIDMRELFEPHQPLKLSWVHHTLTEG